MPRPAPRPPPATTAILPASGFGVMRVVCLGKYDILCQLWVIKFRYAGGQIVIDPLIAASQSTIDRSRIGISTRGFRTDDSARYGRAERIRSAGDRRPRSGWWMEPD